MTDEKYRVGIPFICFVIHQRLRCLGHELRGGADHAAIADLHQLLQAGDDQLPHGMGGLGMHQVGGVEVGFTRIFNVCSVWIQRCHLQGQLRRTVQRIADAVAE